MARTTNIEVDEMKDLRTIARGGGIALVGNLSLMLLNFVFQLILARGLGPNGVGLLGLGLSIINVAIVIVLFGLHQGALRFVASYRAAGDRRRSAGAIQSALKIFFVCSLIATPILWLGSDYAAQKIFNKPDLTPVLRILILNIPLASLVQIFVGVIQAHKLIKYKFIVEQFIVPLLKVLGTVLIIYVISQGVLGIAYTILISNLVGVVLLGFIVWQLYPLRGIRNEKPIPITRDMLHFSVPLLFMGLVNRANNQSETILLGALSTNDQVGIYYIGLKATVFIAMFLDALNVIFAPIIAELYTKKDQVQLASLYKTVTRWAFTLSLPVFLFLFIFSADILEIFGPGFATGVSVLRVLAIAQMVFILTGPSGWILTMTGYPHLNLVNTSLTLVLTVILDLFLIPQYGALGAAIGTAITITLVNILRLFEVNLILHIQPYSSNYYKPIMSGILAMAVSITAGVLFNGALLNIWSTVISGLILTLSYFLALFILGLDNSDQEIVSAIRSRVGRIALSLQK